MVKKIVSLLITSVIHFSILAQDNIKVEGVIIDGNKETLPYTAVSILSKYIGTVSNDDGAFLLKLKKSNINDTITIISRILIKWCLFILLYKFIYIIILFVLSICQSTILP